MEKQTFREQRRQTLYKHSNILNITLLWAGMQWIFARILAKSHKPNIQTPNRGNGCKEEMEDFTFLAVEFLVRALAPKFTPVGGLDRVSSEGFPFIRLGHSPYCKRLVRIGIAPKD